MIELHPRQMHRLARREALALRGGSAFGVAVTLRRGRVAWGQVSGGLLLVRWSGERDPLPEVRDWRQTRGTVVGWTPAGGEYVQEWAGVGHAAGAIYHYAAVPVSGGGVIGAIDPLAVQTRIFDGDGVLVGLLPNPPAAVDARLTSGNVPVVSWSYASAGQQAAPIGFAVFAADEGGAYDFGEPVGLVDFEAGRTRYAWAGEALSAGTVRHYTVRAYNASGMSRIPRLAGGASGAWNSVELTRTPHVAAAAETMPAPQTLTGETQ